MKALSTYTILIILLMLLSTFTSGTTGQYPGTNIRGRVVTPYYNSYIPLPSAQVDLFYFDARMPQGQQWRLIASTLTDTYGFYFFRQVAPANYTIWVNRSKSYNIQVVYIDYSRYSYQDINQFLF